MSTTTDPLCPRVLAEAFCPKRPWDVLSRPCLSRQRHVSQRARRRQVAGVAAIATLVSLAPATSQADRLRLTEREGGAEVEVLEEQPDAFIVKIPKGEVALIKRETQTEVKRWKEKKILWEDQGDYLVLSLPKERIAPPPETAAEGTPGYAPAASLKEGLAATGTKGQASTPGMLTGNVTGRALQHGRPLAGCRVKLSVIQGPAAELTRLLGGKSSPQGPGPKVVEATTGTNGVYLFEDVPIGDYDISWLPPGATHWVGWLSEKPDVTVRAGEITQQGDMDL